MAWRPPGASVDAGAERALLANGRSLLPVGVTRVDGQFQRGDTVRICNAAGRAGGAAVTLRRRSLERIMGRRSDEIETILGYEYGETVVHRDDLVVL